MSQDKWLRVMEDHELRALVTEVEARAEQFSAATRQTINDELRRRKMPLIGAGQARF